MPDLAADNALAIDDCSNATVTPLISGAAATPFRAVYDGPGEFIPTGSVEVFQRSPSISCVASDLAGIENSNHLAFDILLDGAVSAKRYSSRGPLEPDDFGTIIIALTEYDQ